MFDRPGHKEPTIIALWAWPRTLSTPFERIFIERSDTEVHHEPFFNAFYYSKDKRSHRELPAEISLEKKQQNYDITVRKLISPCHKKIRFFKDMTLYSYDYLRKQNPEFYQKIINTFIIRDPKESLLSHYKISPDLNLYPEESGIMKSYELFQYVTMELKQPAIVIDADRLSRYPDKVLQEYCDKIGIPHDPCSLSWKPGQKIKEWQDWKEWHIEAENSSEICLIGEEKLEKPIPHWLSNMIQSSQKFYIEMLRYSILGSDNHLILRARL